MAGDSNCESDPIAKVVAMAKVAKVVAMAKLVPNAKTFRGSKLRRHFLRKSLAAFINGRNQSVL